MVTMVSSPVALLVSNSIVLDRRLKTGRPLLRASGVLALPNESEPVRLADGEFWIPAPFAM